MDERELVRKILQGDEKAKSDFYVAYREQVYKYCVFILGYRDQEAQDVVQETFLTAFRKLPEFEFRAGLGTWLTQIGIFLCYNRYRRRVKTLALDREEMEELLDSKALREKGSPAEAEVRQAKQRFLEKCLQKLGKECRQVIQLRDLEGMAYVEIVHHLKIPLGTVMSRLSRCKKALKALVQQALEEGARG